MGASSFELSKKFKIYPYSKFQSNQSMGLGCIFTYDRHQSKIKTFSKTRKSQNELIHSKYKFDKCPYTSHVGEKKL